MSNPAALAAPLLLTPVLVAKPWGGDRLRGVAHDGGGDVPIGESWQVADLARDATSVDDPVSRVAAGPLTGMTLAEIIAGHRTALLGRAAPTPAGRFPLLVKTLDAAETLSVQVHPPRSLAPTATKTESWVVLDTAAATELFLGVRDGVSFDDVAAAAGTTDLVDLLRRVPVGPGDVVHVPAGTIHALGAGAMVAEVQTPSDVTHRLWDWPDQRDGGRELHVEDGLAAVRAGWRHNLDVAVAPAADGRLVTTDAYVLDRETIAADEHVAASGQGGVVRVCIVLDGGLRWEAPADEPHECRRTECVVLPAACEVPLVATEAGTRVLVATPG